MNTLLLAVSTIFIVTVSAQLTPSTKASTDTTPSPTVSPQPPPPAEGSWNVTQDNVTCIRADLTISFEIPVGDAKQVFSLSPKASSSFSNCSYTNTTQTLVLSYDNYVFMMFFEKDSSSVYVRNITLDYMPPNETFELFYHDEKLFPTKIGNSYLCKSGDNISLTGNATMTIVHIHIMAFGTDGVFGNAEECDADITFSEIIPIAVACALAALIIIVLIAYLIGRRRSRQKGYTSV